MSRLHIVDKHKLTNTIEFFIYMAGDISCAKQRCREFCWDTGFCVHIEPVDFIYTGGEETGFRVGTINYPRFPSNEDELSKKVKKLAEILAGSLCQKSYSIVGPSITETFFRTNEKGAQ